METISVVCPKCQHQALVICEGYPGPDHQPARIVCQHCGFNETESESSWKGLVYGRINQRCPTCRHRIEKRLSGPRHLPQTGLDCPECGTEITAEVTWYSSPPEYAHDPFFGLPLWFVGAFRGQELWASNREHLAFIKGFVSAELREKLPNQNTSLSNRLQKWMLDRKNRTAVLRAIEKLENKPLAGAG